MLSVGEDVEADALFKRGWTVSAIARHLEREPDDGDERWVTVGDERERGPQFAPEERHLVHRPEPHPDPA